MAKVFVIAGHGAGDPGAIGNGYTEAERVRALANRIKALGGDDVMLADTSRDWYADGGISTLAISKDYQIVELHMDWGAASKRGGHVIVNGAYQADEYDKALADFISGILPGRSNKLVGRTDLGNLNRAAAKGYSYRLIECGFISNSEDVAIFNSRMDEIATGILNAFGIRLGGWQKDAVGWWWRNADGSYPKLAWKLINHHWYYFDQKGYMATGWKVIGGSWYYFGADGAMKTGWQYIGGQTYYFHSAGRMLTGWQTINGATYYFHSAGRMLTGWQMIEEKKYYFEKSGAMVTGIVTIDGKRYRFGSDGVYLGEAKPEGWNKEGESWYYIKSDGSNAVGWEVIGDYYYYFAADGKMMTGWQAVNGNWFYLDQSGRMYEKKWLKDKGKRFWFKAGGYMAKNEVLEIDKKYYAFLPDGHMATSIESGGAIS